MPSNRFVTRRRFFAVVKYLKGIIGHAWLVETEARHKKRTRNETTTLPTATTAPIEPTGSTVTGTLWKMYVRTQVGNLWNRRICGPKKVIRMIHTKFPNGLTELELEDGMLPLSLTGRMAFDHIEDKVMLSIVATKATENSSRMSSTEPTNQMVMYQYSISRKWRRINSAQI